MYFFKGSNFILFSIADSNRYFQSRIKTKTNSTTYEDFDNLECLYERTTHVLRLINEIIEKSEKVSIDTTLEQTTSTCQSEENTSYLDMSMRKYESYELKKSNGNFNPNDYVDVSSKASKEYKDDDNIYDNYIVERNGKSVSVRDITTTSETVSKNDVSDKRDCPFIGLPAAHLMIMQSPKVGWLTMHLRRKRFIRHFSINFRRKYYTGLVSKQTDKDYYEWWLLMYAGGTSDLKPTICLPLNQFEVRPDHSKISKSDDNQQNENKRNPCKFELNEKNKKKDGKSYCFIAETPEHCEHWINLVKQLSVGLPYIENTFITTAQIRKLPMPPNVKNIDVDRLTKDIDTVDTTANARLSIERENTADTCNYSEGVYEEPEEYYKNVTTSTIMMTTAIVTANATEKTPKLPVKKTPSQSTATTITIDNISSIYDTPKKPVRKSSDAKHDDHILKQKDYCNEQKTVMVHESSRMKIDDEIRSKLSTQLKEQSQNYLSSSSSSSQGRRTNDEEMVRNSTADSTNNKYQLSTMRKWLFSNLLSKLRQSTSSTNFMRKSTGSNTDEITSTQQQQQQPSNQQQSKTKAIASTSDALKRSFSVQPKGTKVHMIINQLEANGQLTLLSGGGTLTSSKCSTPMTAT